MFWTETLPPKANGFVTDLNAAFVQQIFDIPKRQREPDIKHPEHADDL